MTQATELTGALLEAIVALDRIEKQFTFYAEYHKKQGKNEKSATNYGYAFIAGRALERLKMLKESSYEV